MPYHVFLFSMYRKQHVSLYLITSVSVCFLLESSSSFYANTTSFNSAFQLLVSSLNFTFIWASEKLHATGNFSSLNVSFCYFLRSEALFTAHLIHNIIPCVVHSASSLCFSLSSYLPSSNAAICYKYCSPLLQWLSFKRHPVVTNLFVYFQKVKDL